MASEIGQQLLLFTLTVISATPPFCIYVKELPALPFLKDFKLLHVAKVEAYTPMLRIKICL